MTTIHHLLEEFRQEATSSRDLGDRFENLMVAFLKSDPMYQDLFSSVWTWGNFPKRGNAPDRGVDLVAAERATGDLWAIQCKFYDPNHTLDKPDIDSFFTESGKAIYNFRQRMIISTTDNWGKNAEDAIRNQQIPVKRVLVQDLAESPVDWGSFSSRQQGLQLQPKKEIRLHQKMALDKVMAGFQESNRGKLIMACGTGKTYTALKIAEQFALNAGSANVLFLVPSISLLSQTLREWSAESVVTLHSVAVCSDTKVSKKSDTEDISSQDLAFPATTDAKLIAARVQAFAGQRQLTVIFSTYQSIQAIADAQKQGLPEFDLIICDEAHRTTGVTLAGNDESHFVKVHDQSFLKGKRRLYMTATPKLYSDSTKVQARENEATLCSMDDETKYGQEFHRLGFSEAVSSGLLTDYKVIVLAVDEKYVSRAFQRQIADEDNELNLEDAARITGCWKGLSRQIATDAEGNALPGAVAPMRRAVAFCNKIIDSKTITKLFAQVVEQLHQLSPNDENFLLCEMDHVDGTQNSLERNKKLNWLKEDTSDRGNVCRILSNARCLSEGVDVPSLDAVMFLSPRNSMIDVVQSVGRVMRKSEGKEYGYIILPIGIPADLTPEEALKDNKKYEVVWQVLRALRSHDDRFNHTINKLELNQSKPKNLDFIGVGGGVRDDQEVVGDLPTPVQLSINFPHLEEWREAIYTKIVAKCGDRRYWESWAADVAEIAERHVTRIKALLADPALQHRSAFNDFLLGLQSNVNPSVSETEAIEMLSQHLITKPIFDALFEDYPFTQQNPVSVSMQRMLDLLEGESLEKDTRKLDKFYASVRDRASGIDNAQARQKIVIELYDKFFRNAFPKMAERLGIVYTPVEVVDFIIHSADFALRQEFGVGLTDENVHVLDPFTGTGTFIVRLLQSGLIKREDLARKFRHELYANEIVLLAYYIAAVNIEGTYHSLVGGEYAPFEGIVLTDTFQMYEGEGTLDPLMFPENNQRVNRQKENDIRVIIGNPPYSAGQTSENDGNKNLKYPQLDKQIRDTYAEYSTATNKNGLYDSYIRAIRWGSDRIKDKGIVCFVSNGSFIDKGFADGLRKCLVNEFTNIYCFNLRGFIRGQSGDDAKKEGQNIFNIMTGVAILVLIKNPDTKQSNKVNYYDIGDYLTREQKLNIIQIFANISNVNWQELTPNDNDDWINQRNSSFDSFISLGDKKDKTSKTIFDLYSRGFETRRDAWAYNFSRKEITENISRMIEFYNEQVKSYIILSQDSKIEVDNFVSNDTKKISWSRRLKGDLEKRVIHSFNKDSLSQTLYRPFTKQLTYFDRELSDFIGQMPKIFPNQNLENVAICVSGIGCRKGFSALTVNQVPDLELIEKSQCFPLYSYEKQETTDQGSLLPTQEGYVKKENIPDDIQTEFRETYQDQTISKEDIFYYVYGILHSPEYKQRFAADLKKMLPRIPYAADFWAFSTAGRNLAHWHLNYESIEPYNISEYWGKLFLEPEDYLVEKMKFGYLNKTIDKTTIIYNSHIKLHQIPREAYEYIVNGKPALEWIMERYQLTTDKASGITNNPNHWSEDPRYIIDLVRRIVRVSMETVAIVKSLPSLNERQ